MIGQFNSPLASSEKWMGLVIQSGSLESLSLMTTTHSIQSVGSLSGNNAAVWWTNIEDVSCPDLLAQYEHLLDDGERKRHRAFHFPDDRHLFLVAHALLRTSLSQYAGVQPQDWRFASEEHGRPQIAAAQREGGGIQFNLSHARGLAACAIARDVSIGIDVECLERNTDWGSIAGRYFSRFETRALAALPVGEQPERFFEYWTLKEAYVKAQGGGLSIPLDSFSFYHDDRWRIAFRDTEDDANEWQFACLRPTARHVMSIAIHAGSKDDYELDIRRTIPLGAA
jgi:4'-phosphopantetheinyl transferase